MLRAVMCADGVEDMTTRAKLAVDQEPDWSPWRDTALALYGEALLLAGDPDQAVAAFAESSSAATASGNNGSIVISEAELALLAMDRGQWTEAEDHVATALEAIEGQRMHDYAMAGLTYAGAARLALHRGDLVGTNRQLAQGMRARPLATFVLPWLAVTAAAAARQGVRGTGGSHDGPAPAAGDRRRPAAPAGPGCARR